MRRIRRREWIWWGRWDDLFGVVEALVVVLAEEGADLGLPALGHALAKVEPEVVASPLVPRYPPSLRHRLPFSFPIPFYQAIPFDSPREIPLHHPMDRWDRLISFSLGSDPFWPKAHAHAYSAPFDVSLILNTSRLISISGSAAR